MKLYLGICFEFFKSPVFLWKLCICPMFFMIEWFLMVSITLFKCTFAGSAVYFLLILLKVWCNFYFTYYVRNLELVGKGTIRFIYTITFHCFCFLFRGNFFVMHIDNWFNICHAAITYFHIILLSILCIYGCLENIFESKKEIFTNVIGDIPWKRQVESDDVSFAILGHLLLFSFSFFGDLYCSL